ncbi:MAG: hypothetical protein FWE11_03110 [Defluviitaleaceae bacterium]|nr:hypothetical protein [Defluviitaleaceae bacterium]
MDIQGFETFKNQFRIADTDTKISMYVEAEDLTHGQYKELLQLFPLKDLQRLEAALG